MDNKDKGVIVKVFPDENMPIDKHGTRADMIQDPGSVANRMNPTKLYEHYINCTSDQVERELRQALANGYTEKAVEWCWQRVLRYYQIISPTMYDKVTSKSYHGTPKQHIESLLTGKQGIRLHLPTNISVDIADAVKQLAIEFPVDYGPVSYVGMSGNRTMTKTPVMIGSNYVILLEKTGSDWSACSSGTLQQHGILTKLTRRDKHSRPGRSSPGRCLGEDETRSISAVSTSNTTAQLLVPKYGPTAGDGLAIAELMDMANSPVVHQEVVRRILTADQPSNIQTIVDRKKFPRGDSRSLRFVSHHLETGGVKLMYEDDRTFPETIYNVEDLDDGSLDVDEEEDALQGD